MNSLASFILLLNALTPVLVIVTADAKEDVCAMPKVIGPCRASKKRFYFNNDTGLCNEFKYGGCGGNSNNFMSKTDCMQACVCSLPAKTGYCRARFPSYGYDAKSGKCLPFTWGGCYLGGNGNVFRDRRSCEETCGEV